MNADFTYKTGSIISLNDNSKKIPLFISNYISHDGYVVSQENLLKYKPELVDIFYNDLIVGKVKYASYSTMHQCFFVHLKTNEHFPRDYSTLRASPVLDIRKIECPRCNRIYVPASNHCDCVVTAAITLLHEFSIKYIQIYDTLHNNSIENIKRENALNNFFAGIVFSLSLEEAI